MKIDLALWADRIEDDEERPAVVIDVLRASSTIVTALSNGAQAILPTASIEAARAKEKETANSLVAGERNGVQIADFDLGNSPLDYKEEQVAAKKIILTTTNGTKCFNHLSNAQEVVIASLLNLEAVVDYLAGQKEVLLCCAGNYGDFAFDDMIVAGKIIAKLRNKTDIELSDKGQAAEELYVAHQSDLLAALLNSDSGKNLKKLGYQEDIKYIINQQENVIPLYQQGVVNLATQGEREDT